MGPLIMLLCSAALADTSGPVEFVLQDELPLFTDAEYDSGWRPDGRNLQVRFQVLPVGSADVEMEGEATLQWPDAFGLNLAGTEEKGRLTLDAGLELVTSVKFDIGSYSWEEVIDSRSFVLQASETFTPFLLAEAPISRVEVTDEGDGREVFSVEIDPFPVVSLAFEAEVASSVVVGYSGVAWGLDGELVESPEQNLPINAAKEDSWLEVQPVLHGEWDSEIGLVLTPSVSVCVDVLGCTELASFDVDLPIRSGAVEQSISTGPLGFGVPKIGVYDTVVEFGEIEVGEVAMAQVAIENLGESQLDGSVGILGSGAFQVFPEGVLANPSQVDGVVVEFSPSTVGEVSASLMIDTNDPYQPLLEIELVGQGVNDQEAQDSETVGASGSVRTCGCVASTESRFPWAWLGVTGLVALSRRRA